MQLDAARDDMAQQRDRRGLRSAGGPQTAAAGDVERAEAQALDREVAADGDGRAPSDQLLVGGGPPSSMPPQPRPKYSGLVRDVLAARH